MLRSCFRRHVQQLQYSVHRKLQPSRWRQDINFKATVQSNFANRRKQEKQNIENKGFVGKI